MGIEQKLERYSFKNTKIQIRSKGEKLEFSENGAKWPEGKGFMYALVYKGKVFYVGETTRGLKDRMKNYINKPGESQSTNKKVQAYIKGHSPVMIFYREQERETINLINSNSTERFLSKLLNKE